MSTLTELFPSHEVLDYTNAIQAPQYLGAQLFPSRKVQSNDIKILTSGTVVPTIAHVHAFDTEAEIGSRSGEVASTKPFFIKRKYVVDENDLLRMRSTTNQAEVDYLKQHVYNDVQNLKMSIEATAEMIRIQVLTHGKLTLKDAEGNAYNVDYQIDKSQQGKTDFTDAKTDPIETIESWADTLAIAPTRAVMSQKALATIRRNPNVVANIFGSNNGRTVRQSDLDTFMQANGLPVLRAYKGKYQDTDSKGKTVITPFVGDGDFAMFTDGLVGETIYGLTPEESRAVAAGEVQSSQVGNVMIDEYEEKHDPIESVIKASAMIVPTLAQRETIFQAQVL